MGEAAIALTEFTAADQRPAAVTGRFPQSDEFDAAGLVQHELGVRRQSAGHANQPGPENDAQIRSPAVDMKARPRGSHTSHQLRLSPTTQHHHHRQFPPLPRHQSRLSSLFLTDPCYTQINNNNSGIYWRFYSNSMTVIIRFEQWETLVNNTCIEWNCKQR